MKKSVLVLISAVLSMAASQVCKRGRSEREESREGLEEMWPVFKGLDCSRDGIDAAVTLENGQGFFFKGEFYWRMEGRNVAQGYPRLITQDWDGLPGYLDAAFTWTDGRALFFKGEDYWSFHGKKMDKGYPKCIKDGFNGVSGNLDAALQYRNDNVYFFKGTTYWRFMTKSFCKAVSGNYPVSITANWKNLTTNLDAAVKWTDGQVYFFKGLYAYKYNYTADAVTEKPFLINTKWDFNCLDLNCRIPLSVVIGK